MELLNIFQNIGDWFSDKTAELLITIALSFVTGFVAKKGWSVTIDKIAKKGKVISKKIELALMEGAEVAGAGTIFFSKVDEAIKDDGKIDQNSLKEAIKAGKEVVIESKDVIAVIKGKPVLKAIAPKQPEVKSAQVEQPKIVNKRPKYRHK